MIDLWFGDSWVIGSELGEYYGKKTLSKKFFPAHHENCRADLSFAKLVSDHRDSVYFNFAIDGGSYNHAYYQLVKFCKKHKNLTNATAFLCTTGQTRDFALDFFDEQHHFIPHVFRSPDTRFDLHKSDLKFSLYDSTVILNSFYHACHYYGIRLIIIPIWCIFEENRHVYSIPDENWLIPRDQNITSMTIFKNYPISNMEPQSGEPDALLANHKQNQYIYPCQLHPNTEGHKKIASKIIELLQQKD
jgi:hypothetical protein